jgi:hypothetical protein
MTDSVEDISWVANIYSIDEETICLLWNQEVHYRVNKILTVVHILNQMNPVHINNHNSLCFISILFSHVRLHF